MSSEIIISLITLVCLEIILGIDNIIFISILTDKLPSEQRKKARLIGLSLALILRLILLAGISWVLKLDQALFTIYENSFSGKDIILIAGGLFLLYKSSKEIFEKTEDKEKEIKIYSSFNNTIGQILIFDLVFSVDSIITAVGLVDKLWIMYVAVITSIIIMLLVSKSISKFIKKHPSLKILALCFLMMIGLALIAEAFKLHIPKVYIYFSMAFSFFVNLIQIKKKVYVNNKN